MYNLLDMLVAPQQGLAPYGIRHAGDSVKGKGFFGLLQRPDGASTEISSEDNVGEFPLLVPTLTQGEIDHLISGNDPTDAIYQKAMQWADFRRSQDMSPFSSPTELRVPTGIFDIEK